MLEAASKQVYLGGNIGVPPLDFLDKLNEESWVVLELSSFQLADLRYSPQTAVCLMMAPEHLNWHADMDDYIIAKAHLFEHQQPNDLAIYFGPDETSQRIAAYSPGLKLPYFRSPGAFVDKGAITIDNQVVCHTNELKLLGRHNWQNVCAAITVVWQSVQSISEMRMVLTTFTGLEHRLEFVREIDRNKFYNDSYSSVPNATSAALEAIPGPKVIIVGGFDRNLPLNSLVESIRGHAEDIRKVVLIGASSQRIANELNANGFTNFSLEPAKQMDQIIVAAQAFAQPGDSIILSPGFPSFDMFKNFTDRGLQFKSVVEQL
jgi:UDP-N-acetylmuramoylalanine--D-glutamate ligase